MMVWSVTLESPLETKEIQPDHPKEISPEYALEGLMLNLLKLQHFGHVMRRADSLENTLTLGKIEGGRRRGGQGGQGGLAAVHGVARSQTRLSD